MTPRELADLLERKVDRAAGMDTVTLDMAEAKVLIRALREVEPEPDEDEQEAAQGS